MHHLLAFWVSYVYLLILHVCVGGKAWHFHSMCVAVRGQLWGVAFVLLCVSQGIGLKSLGSMASVFTC